MSMRHQSGLSRVAASFRIAGEQLTGHGEVLGAQLAVRERREELREARTSLLLATRDHEALQEGLRRVYARKALVYQESRRDLAALKDVHDEEEALLHREEEQTRAVEACRARERESFEGLSEAIAESHEKERAQSERTKYYSRVGSLLGALVGFLGSQAFLRREIRQHLRTQEAALGEITETLSGFSGSGEENGAEVGVEGGGGKLGEEIRRLGAVLTQQTQTLDSVQVVLRGQAHVGLPGDGQLEKPIGSIESPNQSAGSRDLFVIGLVHAVMWMLCSAGGR